MRAAESRRWPLGERKVFRARSGLRILIVTQYFWPENFRVNDLAEALAERGHRVTVLTGLPNYPAGRFFEGYGYAGPYREQHAGVRIVRVPLIPRGNGGSIRLALNYFSFALMASLVGPLRLGRDFDAIFVHEPSPVTVGLPAIVMKCLTRAPIAFWALDLWPESVAATGALRSPLLLGWIARLVRFIYRHCDRILVSSHGFIPKVLAAGGEEGKIRYFPNWAESLYGPLPRTTPPPAPLPEGFRVMFAGNVGAAQDFPAILDAAELLKAETRIHWVILGEGRMLDWLRSETARRNLGATVHLQGQHPASSMPAFFAHADAMLVSLTDDPVFALTVPAKIQAYLACGRPIVAMLDGEGARVVREARAGIICPPGNGAALAQAVLALARMSDAEREQLGANGLACSRSEFDRATLLVQLEQWLAEAAHTQPFQIMGKKT